MNREPLTDVRVLALTGGIGSGKSVVSRCLRSMGIPVYDCDREARRLNESHPVIRQQLTELVGNAVYDSEGRLDRAVLAGYLFADVDHARRVNAIIHPRVAEDFLHWKSCQQGPWVAMESAILYESGFDCLADRVLMVYAPECVRLQRAMERDGVSAEAVRRRMRNQLPDEEKREKADFTLYNDGRMPVLPQILDILGLLFCEIRE